MTPRFNRVTIIGVGLLGASLGLALKARGLAGHVRGVGHRQATLELALRKQAIDSASLDPAEAVRDADLVVIATPAALVIEKLDEIQHACSPLAVVTDVASTKAQICAHAAARWPQPRRFVGSHPMAGSEKFGPEHGHPDFYENTVCLVERDEALDPSARETVAALWSAIGARVVDTDPARHDLILAHTSHLPHVAAAALATLAARQGSEAEMIGQGFRDVTRIAASRPEVWRDICLTNREALLAGLESLRGQLAGFADALERGDVTAIEAFFREGQTSRRRMVGP
jgi:prephenate dehydrogenase